VLPLELEKKHLCRTAGEILPQAVCRSYGLQVGSYSSLLR
jgi:hypothetical protein